MLKLFFYFQENIMSVDSQNVGKLYDDKFRKFAAMDKYENGKCKRITKKKLMAFLEWMFDTFGNGDTSAFSAQMLSNLYLEETGNYISNATIRNNKSAWIKNNKGEIVKIR